MDGDSEGKMKELCKLCKHYEYIPKEKIYRCSKNGLKHDEYGTFRQGANCIHEEYLKDMFEPIEENEYFDKIKNFEKRVSIYLSENRELKEQNEKLRQAFYCME